MCVAWDPDKAIGNVDTHGILFGDAEGVLFDPRAISVEDGDARAEQRLITIGMDHLGRILVVVYTYRDDVIRMISARRSTRNERKSDESGI